MEFQNKSWIFKSRAQGIPIGNLTSQFGANLYLNSLDHFIQRTLNVKGYLRYMDDLLLLDTDLEKLKPLEQVIQDYLQTQLKQSLNFDKTDLVPLTKGITYLGYDCKQIFNQKEPLQIYAPKKKKWQLIAELKKIEHKIQPENDKKSIQNTIDPHPLSFLILKNKAELASINSRLGLLKYTNSTRFKKYALDKFKYNLTENKYDPSDLSLKYCPIEVSKEYGSLKFK